MSQIVSLKDVSKFYKHPAGKVTALNKINLDIEATSSVAITGPSGSGKSTLLNMIGVIDTPSEGSVSIDQTNVSEFNSSKQTAFRANNIGFVFQFFYLQPFLNVRENIALPLTFLGKEDPAYVQELLESVGISDRAEHLPNQLSGGQIQRVAIARALVTKPSIILADEPTGNLDSKTGQQIIELLDSTREKFKATLIVVTHDEQLAKKMQKVISIVDGKLQ